MKTPEEFLAANGFVAADEIDRSALIARFTAAMRAGLAGEPSSLKMLKAYVAPSRRDLTGRRAVVLDAGGTNFRGAVVEMPPRILLKRNQPMPGVTKEVDEESFYRTFADEVTRCLPEANLNRIGWCFSYPAEATPELDARLITWTKNIKAPAIVGEYVGSELLKRLGSGPRDGGTAPAPLGIAVVNDTVATLLAAVAVAGSKRYSSYIGFILGTGNNTAYVDPGLEMIVNAESGNFDQVPRSAFDRVLDERSGNPGQQFLEKMIGGSYLGAIGLEILKGAAKAGYFSPRGAAVVKGLGSLSTRDLDEFCAGWSPALDLGDADAQLARRFAVPVFERAAVLAATELASFAIQSGEGVAAEEPIAICIDGSTYYKTKTVNFPKVFRKELDEMLVRCRNVHYEIVPQVDDAPMIGAAIAAMMGA